MPSDSLNPQEIEWIRTVLNKFYYHDRPQEPAPSQIPGPVSQPTPPPAPVVAATIVPEPSTLGIPVTVTPGEMTQERANEIAAQAFRPTEQFQAAQPATAESLPVVEPLQP